MPSPSGGRYLVRGRAATITPMKKSYSEWLRDPRWQKKRLEIMQRDGFACRSCSSTTATLNVHHNYYERRRLPWEYNESALVTLCEDCHKKEGDGKDALNNRLIHVLRVGGAMNCDIQRLIYLITDITQRGESKAGVPLIMNALDGVWTEYVQRRAS
jgi:hypothetical protein